jgi:hypothetical protein
LVRSYLSRRESMNRFQRLTLALVILLSGLALAPYIALPSEKLVWQRYADAYQPPHAVFLPLLHK